MGDCLLPRAEERADERPWVVRECELHSAVGAGGLGDVGIRYGYQRFDATVMVITIVILVVLVQLIQSIGDYLVKRVDHR